jgi:hypothetical protein
VTIYKLGFLALHVDALVLGDPSFGCPGHGIERRMSNGFSDGVSDGVAGPARGGIRWGIFERYPGLAEEVVDLLEQALGVNRSNITSHVGSNALDLHRKIDSFDAVITELASTPTALEEFLPLATRFCAQGGRVLLLTADFRLVSGAQVYAPREIQMIPGLFICSKFASVDTIKESISQLAK